MLDELQSVSMLASQQPCMDALLPVYAVLNNHVRDLKNLYLWLQSKGPEQRPAAVAEMFELYRAVAACWLRENGDLLPAGLSLSEATSLENAENLVFRTMRMFLRARLGAGPLSVLDINLEECNRKDNVTNGTTAGPCGVRRQLRDELARETLTFDNQINQSRADNTDGIENSEALSFEARRFLELTEFLKASSCQQSVRCRLPLHLVELVIKQRDTYIDNAFLAHFLLEEGKHYVITGSPPEIGPVDLGGTGLVLQQTRWSNGLHQALQLKHNLGLTPESLCTNYESNQDLFARYSCILGLTGTLGSPGARDMLQQQYNLCTQVLPRHRPSAVVHFPSVVCPTRFNWYIDVINSAVSHASNLRRAVVVYCANIRQAHLMYRLLCRHQCPGDKTEGTGEAQKVTGSRGGDGVAACPLDYDEAVAQGDMATAQIADELFCQLKPWLQPIRNRQQLLLHERNDREHQIIADAHLVEPGNIIVTTCLLGRGTDFRLSAAVRSQGGLHCILAYLPVNSRQEQQMLGRVGRGDDPGSTQLIVCQDDLEGWNTGGGLADPTSMTLTKARENRDVAEAEAFAYARKHICPRNARKAQAFQLLCAKLNEDQLNLDAGHLHWAQRRVARYWQKALRQDAEKQWAVWLKLVDERFSKWSADDVKKEFDDFWWEVCARRGPPEGPRNFFDPAFGLQVANSVVGLFHEFKFQCFKADWVTNVTSDLCRDMVTMCQHARQADKFFDAQAYDLEAYFQSQLDKDAKDRAATYYLGQQAVMAFQSDHLAHLQLLEWLEGGNTITGLSRSVQSLRALVQLKVELREQELAVRDEALKCIVLYPRAKIVPKETAKKEEVPEPLFTHVGALSRVLNFKSFEKSHFAGLQLIADPITKGWSREDPIILLKCMRGTRATATVELPQLSIGDVSPLLLHLQDLQVVSSVTLPNATLVMASGDWVDALEKLEQPVQGALCFEVRLLFPSKVPVSDSAQSQDMSIKTAAPAEPSTKQQQQPPKTVQDVLSRLKSIDPRCLEPAVMPFNIREAADGPLPRDLTESKHAEAWLWRQRQFSADEYEQLTWIGLTGVASLKRLLDELQAALPTKLHHELELKISVHEHHAPATNTAGHDEANAAVATAVSATATRKSGVASVPLSLAAEALLPKVVTGDPVLVKVHGLNTEAGIKVLEKTQMKFPQHTVFGLTVHYPEAEDAAAHLSSVEKGGLKPADLQQKPTAKHLKSVVNSAQHASELPILAANGMEYVFELNIRPPIPWITTLVLGALAATQIVVGTVMVGMLAPTAYGSVVGIGLICEGISDLLEMGRAAYFRQFSWRRWLVSKAVSLALCFGTAGLSSGRKVAQEAMEEMGTGTAKMLGNRASNQVSTAVVNTVTQVTASASGAVVELAGDIMTRQLSPTALANYEKRVHGMVDSATRQCFEFNDESCAVKLVHLYAVGAWMATLRATPGQSGTEHPMKNLTGPIHNEMLQQVRTHLTFLADGLTRELSAYSSDQDLRTAAEALLHSLVTNVINPKSLNANLKAIFVLEKSQGGVFGLSEENALQLCEKLVRAQVIHAHNYMLIIDRNSSMASDGQKKLEAREKLEDLLEDKPYGADLRVMLLTLQEVAHGVVARRRECSVGSELSLLEDSISRRVAGALLNRLMDRYFRLGRTCTLFMSLAAHCTSIATDLATELKPIHRQGCITHLPKSPLQRRLFVLGVLNFCHGLSFPALGLRGGNAQPGLGSLVLFPLIVPSARIKRKLSGLGVQDVALRPTLDQLGKLFERLPPSGRTGPHDLFGRLFGLTVEEARARNGLLRIMEDTVRLGNILSNGLRLSTFSNLHGLIGVCDDLSEALAAPVVPAEMGLWLLQSDDAYETAAKMYLSCLAIGDGILHRKYRRWTRFGTFLVAFLQKVLVLRQFCGFADQAVGRGQPEKLKGLVENMLNSELVVLPLAELVLKVLGFLRLSGSDVTVSDEWCNYGLGLLKKWTAPDFMPEGATEHLKVAFAAVNSSGFCEHLRACGFAFRRAQLQPSLVLQLKFAEAAVANLAYEGLGKAVTGLLKTVPQAEITPIFSRLKFAPWLMLDETGFARDLTLALIQCTLASLSTLQSALKAAGEVALAVGAQNAERVDSSGASFELLTIQLLELLEELREQASTLGGERYGSKMLMRTFELGELMLSLVTVTLGTADTEVDLDQKLQRYATSEQLDWEPLLRLVPDFVAPFLKFLCDASPPRRLLAGVPGCFSSAFPSRMAIMDLKKPHYELASAALDLLRRQPEWLHDVEPEHVVELLISSKDTVISAWIIDVLLIWVAALPPVRTVTFDSSTLSVAPSECPGCAVSGDQAGTRQEMTASVAQARARSSLWSMLILWAWILSGFSLAFRPLSWASMGIALLLTVELECDLLVFIALTAVVPLWAIPMLPWHIILAALLLLPFLKQHVDLTVLCRSTGAVCLTAWLLQFMLSGWWWARTGGLLALFGPTLYRQQLHMQHTGTWSLLVFFLLSSGAAIVVPAPQLTLAWLALALSLPASFLHAIEGAHWGLQCFQAPNLAEWARALFHCLWVTGNSALFSTLIKALRRAMLGELDPDALLVMALRHVQVVPDSWTHGLFLA